MYASMYHAVPCILPRIEGIWNTHRALLTIVQVRQRPLELDIMILLNQHSWWFIMLFSSKLYR